MRRLKNRAPALPAIAVCLLVFLILLEIFRFIQPSTDSKGSDPQAGRFFFSDLEYIRRDLERDNVSLAEWKDTHGKKYREHPWKIQAEFLHERIRTAGLPLVDFSPDDPRGDVPVPLCQAQDRDSPPSSSYTVGSFQRKVYDVVTFLDELDTLEIRLQTLYPVVDKFILIMCERSFMNNTVQLIDVKTLPRFARYKDKIQNVYCDLGTWPLHDPSPWNREDHMRNVTMDAVSGIDDEDVAMMGDLDELPKPWVVNVLRTNASQEFPVVIHMPLYRFSFGCIEPRFEAEEQWPGTVGKLSLHFCHFFHFFHFFFFSHFCFRCLLFSFELCDSGFVAPLGYSSSMALHIPLFKKGLY
jgi:hypothetical protein